MKILQFFAAMISRKSSAPKIINVLAEDPAEYLVSDHIADFSDVAYDPKPMVGWYAVYLHKMYPNKTIRTDVSQILALNLLHPKTTQYLRTVFAVQADGGYYWVEVGGTELKFSKAGAFMYCLAENFRFPLRTEDKKVYVATCLYKNGTVAVEAIVAENFVPPTDTDQHQSVSCKILPCSIRQAMGFVSLL